MSIIYKGGRIMITLELLIAKEACDEGIDFFEETFGEQATNEQIINSETPYEYVIWLIAYCEYCQTPEMIEHCKSLNPNYSNVSWLIEYCTYCQTPEMVEYYKSLKPSYGDVSCLITNCKYCQTPEMITYYKSLNPSYGDVSWLITNCEYARQFFQN
jgi:hypothetical protein